MSNVLLNFGRSGKETKWKERVKEKILKFLICEDGLTTVEYAVAGALITAAIVAAFVGLGGQVAAVITFITGEIS